jgi:hypothetical protein
MEQLKLEISENGDLIRIDIIGLENPNAVLDYDMDWIKSNITVKAGRFSGYFSASLMTNDFEVFKSELEILYNKLDGIALFQTLENQIYIKVVGDGIGHLNAKCRFMDFAGHGNELIFEMNFDQTQIPKIINQLEKITKKYKII